MEVMRSVVGERKNIVVALAMSNIVSIFLLLVRAISTGTTDYWFMLWNLVLAWVPVGVSVLLIQYLRTHSWREPGSVLQTLLWLFFLPNSFYMISDLIHLHATGDITILFDVVMLTSFIWNGLVAGFLSIFLLHKTFQKFRPAGQSHLAVVALFVAISFAIYMGRTLRWNSWDVLVNPGGILYDVSERVINPFSYPAAVLTTGLFFLLLGSMYFVIYQFSRLKQR